MLVVENFVICRKQRDLFYPRCGYNKLICRVFMKCVSGKII